jgi:hypothetical protein
MEHVLDTTGGVKPFIFIPWDFWTGRPRERMST